MSLAKKAAAGFVWSTIANLGSRVFTIISTFILTRYLAPEVLGEVNLANVLVQTAGAATGLGVVQYVAAHPDADRGTVFHGTVLVLGAGVIACLASVALGAPVAGMLGTPGMIEFVPGLALSHFVDRMSWLPRSILIRDLRFRTAGIRVAVGELTFASSSILFAHLGWGGHAIVAGNLARAGAVLLFSFAVTNLRDYLEPCRLAWARFARLLRYGSPITIAALFHIGATTWDNSFMGWRFGGATVGIYNQAYRLAELPATNVGDQIADVVAPIFARVTEPEARRRGFLRAAGLMGLVIFPMALGLGAVAHTAVAAFYPPNYQSVAPFLVVLASLGVWRAIGNLASAFLQVVGRTRVFIPIDIVLVVTVLGFMAIGAEWGEVSAAVGVGVAFTLATFLTIRALRPDGITLTAVLRSLAPPLLACVPMILGVLGVRLAMGDVGLPAGLRLIIELACGGVVYVIAALIVARSIARDFLDLMLGMIRRKRGGGDTGGDAPAVP